MVFSLLSSKLLPAYERALQTSPVEALKTKPPFDMPVDYFEFYHAVSSVYSSKIEGDDIEFDSYYKHKFLQVEFQPDYTRRADDLYAAYRFMEDAELTLENLKKAHALFTASILPEKHRGQWRRNPMFVLNSADRIEYVAAAPEIVPAEVERLWSDIKILLEQPLSDFEVFYYAAYIHLVFVKIHPFQDGNGRAARLLEKWFLVEKLGKEAALAIPLEKNYYLKREAYYASIRKLGLEYGELDYSKSLDFLLMTGGALCNR